MRSDEALFEDVSRGDLRAFDELYQRHARPLYGFVRRMLGDAHESEDVLNECFMTLIRQRDAAQRAHSLRAWLFAVARNLCLNRLRSSKRGARAISAVPEREPLPSPDALLDAKVTAERLRAAVERLSPALAELYALRARGLSNEELAEALNIPLGTVKSRTHEMVRKLREEMNE